VELITSFLPEQYRDALESWTWIGLAGKRPWFASLFGDVFLQANEGIWYLDTMEGSLSLEWATEDDLRRTLATPEGQQRYLLADLATGAHARGLHLGSDDVYDLVPPPILGGAFDVDHVVVSDFAMTVNVAGQIHEQVRNLPPGTTISGISIDDG